MPDPLRFSRRSLLVMVALWCFAPSAALDGQQTRYGDWIFTERHDPDAGRDTYYAATVAYGGMGGLGVACGGVGVPVIGFTHERLDGDAEGRVDVRYRFGTGATSESARWELLPGHTSTEVPARLLTRFLGRMARDTALTLRIVDPPDEDEVEQEFSLRGFAEAAGKLPCLPDDWASAGEADLSEAPQWTPMTVRPRLRNNAEVARALEGYYPPLLRDAGIGGTVTVWFFIDEEGRVRDVKIREPAGHPAFNDAAVEVAKVMQFYPAYNGDEPVPVWVALDISFEVRRPE